MNSVKLKITIFLLLVNFLLNCNCSSGEGVVIEANNDISIWKILDLLKNNEDIKPFIIKSICKDPVEQNKKFVCPSRKNSTAQRWQILSYRWPTTNGMLDNITLSCTEKYTSCILATQYIKKNKLEGMEIVFVSDIDSLKTISKELKEEAIKYGHLMCNLNVVYLKNTMNSTKDICLLIDINKQGIIKAISPPSSSNSVRIMDYINDTGSGISQQEKIKIKSLIINDLIQSEKISHNIPIFVNVEDYEELNNLIFLLPINYIYKAIYLDKKQSDNSVEIIINIVNLGKVEKLLDMNKDVKKKFSASVKYTHMRQSNYVFTIIKGKKGLIIKDVKYLK